MSFQSFKTEVNNRVSILAIGFLIDNKETEYKDITNYYLVGQPNTIRDSFELIQTRIDQLAQFNVTMNFEDLFSAAVENLTIQELYGLVKKTAQQIDFKVTAEIQTLGHIPSQLSITKEEFDLYQSSIEEQYKIKYNGIEGIWEDEKHVRFGEAVIQISDFKIRAIKAGVSL